MGSWGGIEIGKRRSSERTATGSSIQSAQTPGLRKQLDLPTEPERDWRGWAQFGAFTVIAAAVPLISHTWGLNLSLSERWTLGSIAGIIIASFFDYAKAIHPLINRAMMALFLVIGVVTVAARENSFVHLTLGLVAVIIFSGYDSISFRQHRKTRDDPGSSPFDRRRAALWAQKSRAILCYVNLPQVVALSLLLVYFRFATDGIDSHSIENFIAGAFAFQIFTGSFAVALIEWFPPGTPERERANYA